MCSLNLSMGQQKVLSELLEKKMRKFCDPKTLVCLVQNMLMAGPILQADTLTPKTDS